VHVADVQNLVAVEALRQILEADVVAPQHNALGISPRAPVEAAQLERTANDRLQGIPVFEMKKREALAEDPRFMIGLDAQALPGMQTAEALLQFDQNVLMHPKNSLGLAYLPYAASAAPEATGGDKR
jgi:hypothetical protein